MRRLNLIVAACDNQGIGVNGQLPWDLKNEMKYFNRITTSVADTDKKNVVIMGRKTWESIPSIFRPLKNRINILISSTLSMDSVVSSDTYLFKDFQSSLQFIDHNLSKVVEEVFVIGGTSLYEDALNTKHPIRLYYTRIFATFDVDTYFPKVCWEDFVAVKLNDVPQGIQTEDNITYQFEVYDRN